MAVAAGRPPANGGPVTPRAGETIRLDLRLEEGRALDVVALDAATGRPIAGATATASPSGGSPPASAVTDEEGRARIEGIAPGPLVLEVRAEGHAPWRIRSPTESGPIVARLAAGRVLEGRVLMPDGTPAGGANVSATASDGSGALGWATTAADGTFRLGELPDEEVAIAVTWFGADHLFAEEEARPGSELVVRLSPSRPRGGDRPSASAGAGRPPHPPPSPPAEDPRFVGRVLDPEGRPVSRASARLVTPNGTWGLAVIGGRAIADRRPERESTFEAWGALDVYGRRLPYGPARVAVPAGAAGAEVRLVPEVAVEGRVLGPDGRGVPGVVVYATEPDPGVNVLANLASDSGWSSARSDEAGNYRVGGLVAEPVELRVAPPAGFASGPPVVTRGGATGVEIRLKAGVAPRLRVVDPDGKPLGGVRVAISEAGAPPTPGWPRTTDAEGVITWDALDPALAYRLWVDPNPRQDLVELLVPRWRPRDETLRVPRSCDVRGVLVDGAGQPVAPAMVVRVVGGGEVNHAAFTAPDGRFEFHRVPEGEVVLRASLDGSLATAEAIVTAAPAAPEVAFVLDLGTEWRVRIDGWAGAVAPGHVAYASVYQGAPVRGTPHAAAEVATDGTFVVSGARRGVDYTVWVPSGGDRYVLASGLRWSAEGATLTTSSGLSITGTVKIPEGVTGLRVWARRDALNATGEVGADGRYVVRGLPPGSWTVVADAVSSWHAEAPATAGGEADLTLKSTLAR
jgi:hypothetical protein